MHKDNKLILKNTLILYIKLIITSIIGLFTSRYLFLALGASDFGLYNVVGGVVIMMAFINTVMISTTFRFITFEMGKSSSSNINKVFNISLVIHLFLAILVLLLTETIGVWYINNYLNVATGKIYDALFVLRFSTYATIFSIVSIPYQALIIAKENFALQASTEIIRSISTFLIALILLYNKGNNLRLYAVLMVIISAIPSTIFFIYCKFKYKELIHWRIQTDKKKYKEMISFSGWISLGAAASVGQSTGSNLVINSFFGTVMNASFGIANQVNGIVSMFARNLSQAAIPQITKSFSSGNADRTIHLTAYISKYTVLLMFIPALPILLKTEFLLNFWLGKFPPYTVVFCQLTIINALVNALGSGLPAIVQATGKIKYFQIILSVTSLISLPISYFAFTAGYTPTFILWTYIISALVNIVIWQILLKRIIEFDIKFFLKTSYLRIIYVAALVVPLFYLKEKLSEGFSQFLLISIFSIIWLLIVVFFIGLDKKEKSMVINLISKLIQKK